MVPTGPIKTPAPWGGPGNPFPFPWENLHRWDHLLGPAGQEFGPPPSVPDLQPAFLASVLKAMMAVETGGVHRRADGSVITRDDGLGDGPSVGLMQVKPQLHAHLVPGVDADTEEGNVRLAAAIMARAIRDHGSWEAALTTVYFPATDPGTLVTQQKYLDCVRGLLAEMGEPGPGVGAVGAGALAFFTDLAAAVANGGRAVVRSFNGLNLRAAPSIQPGVQVLTTMPDGAAFTLTGNGRLGLVEGTTADGRRGWVLEEFLTAPNGFLGPGAVAAVNAAGAELRAGPSLEERVPVLDVLAQGVAFTLTGSSRLGFVEGTFQGTQGWAFAEFLVAVGSRLPLSAIWSNVSPAPVNQGHGVNAFAVTRPDLYGFTLSYCPDWCPDPNSPANCSLGHPGYDIGVAFGTPLFTPVAGRVVCAGNGVGGDEHAPGCGAYRCIPSSGEAQSGRFELELDNGDRLLLGHLSEVTVQPGDLLAPGDQVGLSGRQEGDHVHIEYRQRAFGACHAPNQFRLIDPADVFGFS